MGRIAALGALLIVWLGPLTSSLAFQSTDRLVRCPNRPPNHLLLPQPVPHAKLTASSRNNAEDGRRPRGQRFRSVVKRLLSVPARFRARFLALSTRAKRLVVMQMFILVLACGGIARSAYRPSVATRPVEIAYSSFLDVVEQQTKRNADAVPGIDQVRIGTDRIVYRLYRKGPSSLPSIGGPKAKSKMDAPPYLSAYTRKISASPELIQMLRKHDISFAAAPAPKTSVLALTARSFLVTFYFLILWRLYRTVSGNMGGGGSSDVPGKLAQTSDLPMASFDEIQGIDGAKSEVMELVDTLRHPDKYAILGARAPTGLLLEG